ncbi:MAG: chemotaxis protein methyltransferase CheR [Acidimicrobiaceae bacterium]
MIDLASVDRAAEVLRSRAGFRADPALHGRLVRCLADAAEAEGCGIDDYVAGLSSNDEAIQSLVDRVTIQESSFFRDDAQFLAFADHLLPRLATSTIWSAGCANGQEPWSLAMALDERGRTDCSILATDISVSALARAERGWYATRELRGLNPERRERYFQPSEGGYEVIPALRRLVSFRHHNLAGEAPPITPGSCTVAFCRNVLIYLTDDEISAVLDRLATALGQGGHLFLGYSESLWRLPSRFALRRLGDTFVYEVGSRAADARPRSPEPRPAQPVPARPPRAARERVEPAALEPTPSADEFFESAQAAVAERDLSAAVVAFRKAAYLRPEDPAIALHLAFALEAIGDVNGARPWFRRALETMTNAEPLVSVFEGWSTPELTAVLERKVALPVVDS